MKANAGPVGSIVAGMLIVACVATFTIDGGWFLWIPAAWVLLLACVFARKLG